MDYEEFKEQFVKDVEERLHEQGTEVSIRVQTVNKLNKSYEAATITPKGSNVGVSIDIGGFYNAMEDGASYDEVVSKATELASSGIAQRPDFDISSFSDYSKMKDKLVLEIVSAETNAKMLATAPHQNIEDMAVVYRFLLDSNDDGQLSVLVTNEQLKNMRVTPEQLYADAMENAPKLRPAIIKGMSEVMVGMMGAERAEMMGITLLTPEEEQSFVAMVPDKMHGAAVLAYKGFLEQVAEKVGGDFFVLPSSIHEVLIIPDHGEMDLRELEDMVRNINATQVDPVDKLTDSVYHYDSKEKIFELGEKFAARQAEEFDLDE